jgi:hypothetical protein
VPERAHAQLMREILAAVQDTEDETPDINVSIELNEPLGCFLVVRTQQPKEVIDEDSGETFDVPQGRIIVAASGDTMEEMYAEAHHFLAGRQGMSIAKELGHADE